MKRPLICGVVTRPDALSIEAAAPYLDLFEVRIDLIGPAWQDTTRLLDKPWIATNRLPSEGGRWTGGEKERIEALLKGVGAGAFAVDIELATPDLPSILPLLRNRAECIISYHNFDITPPSAVLNRIIKDEIKAGADICKLVTAARGFDDNISILGLNKMFPSVRMLNFCMGVHGQPSRMLNPLNGGAFTYAALDSGSESAAGQLTVRQLAKLYDELKYD